MDRHPHLPPPHTHPHSHRSASAPPQPPPFPLPPVLQPLLESGPSPFWPTRPAEVLPPQSSSSGLPPSLPVPTEGPGPSVLSHGGRSTELSPVLTPGGHTGPSSYAEAKSKRKRGRMATACKECNKRKQRCDGNQPCANCTRRKVPDKCHFPALEEASSGPLRQVLDSKRRKGGLPRRDIDRGGSGQTVASSETEEELGKDEERVRVNYDYVAPSASQHYHPFSEPIPSHSSTLSRVSSLLPSSLRQYVEPERTPIVPFGSGATFRSSFGDSSSTSFSSIFTASEPTLRRKVLVSPPRPLSLDGGTVEYENARRAAIDKAKQKRSASEGTTTPTATRFQQLNEHDVQRQERSGASPQGQDTNTDRVSLHRQAERQAAFFGPSHFGPETVVQFLSSTLETPSSFDNPRNESNGNTPMLVTKPWSVETVFRELSRCLPSKETCDRFVGSYFQRYNLYNDVIYQPDFMESYHQYWSSSMTYPYDLRFLALLLMTLGLGARHQSSSRILSQLRASHSFSSSQHKIQVDTIISELESLAIATDKEAENDSRLWSHAAQRAFAESGTFLEDSLDKVRAGILIAMYLSSTYKPSEAWKVTGQAIRTAQSQDFMLTVLSGEPCLSKNKIQGVVYGLVCAFLIGNFMSFFLGRPSYIQDPSLHQATRPPSNMSDAQIQSMIPQSAQSLISVSCLILNLELSHILGNIVKDCFDSVSVYVDDSSKDLPIVIRRYEQLLKEFERKADNIMALDDDNDQQWARIQNMVLRCSVCRVRMALHRRPFFKYITERLKGNLHIDPLFKQSVDSTLEAAVEELKLRLEMWDHEGFKLMTSTCSGFVDAASIGIALCNGYTDPRFPPEDLHALVQSYIQLQQSANSADCGDLFENQMRALLLIEKQAAEKIHSSKGKDVSPYQYQSPKSTKNLPASHQSRNSLAGAGKGIGSHPEIFPQNDGSDPPPQIRSRPKYLPSQPPRASSLNLSMLINPSEPSIPLGSTGGRVRPSCPPINAEPGPSTNTLRRPQKQHSRGSFSSSSSSSSSRPASAQTVAQQPRTSAIGKLPVSLDMWAMSPVPESWDTGAGVELGGPPTSTQGTRPGGTEMPSFPASDTDQVHWQTMLEPQIFGSTITGGTSALGGESSQNDRVEGPFKYRMGREKTPDKRGRGGDN